MARPQAELQAILESFEGVHEAHFQKPLNIELKDPYIVYDIDNDWVSRADNLVYDYRNRYSVTVVTRSPDSLIPGMVRDMPHARFNRKFISGGLHHFVYTLYF